MADLLEAPRYVDDPPTLLLWRIDDLIPVVVFSSIAILIDQPLLFLVGILLVRLYGRFREGRADGYAMHALYWAGPWRCCTGLGQNRTTDAASDRLAGIGGHSAGAVAERGGRR